MEIVNTDLDHVLLGDSLRDADNERDLRLQRLHDGRRSAYTENLFYSLLLFQVRKALSSGQIYEEKKIPQKTKKIHWAGFKKKPGFFQTCIRICIMNADQDTGQPHEYYTANNILPYIFTVNASGSAMLIYGLDLKCPTYKAGCPSEEKKEKKIHLKLSSPG
jgi:hypothetical protein